MSKRKARIREMHVKALRVAQYSGAEAIERLIEQVKSGGYPRRIMHAYLMIDVYRYFLKQYEAEGRVNKLARIQASIAKLERRIADWWPTEIARDEGA